MSIAIDFRIQYLTLQRSYLQAQIMNNWSRGLYASPLENCLLQTQLKMVNAELDSLTGKKLDKTV